MRGGLLDAQVRWLPEHELRRQGNGASEGPRPERHHLVTNRPLRDATTNRRDAADAFVSKRTGGPLIRPKRIQDVAEVEADGLDLDLDFAGSGRLAVARLQEQAVEQARLPISSSTGLLALALPASCPAATRARRLT